jgi:hypothetical protein
MNPVAVYGSHTRTDNKLPPKKKSAISLIFFHTDSIQMSHF